MSQGKKTALLAARTGEEAHNAKTGAITLRTGYRIREQLPKRQQREEAHNAKTGAITLRTGYRIREQLPKRQQTDRTTTLVSK